MKIRIVNIGRFKSREYLELVQNYVKLASRFTDVAHEILPDPKSNQTQDEILLKWLESRPTRYTLSILDEKGKQFTSRDFASHIEKVKNQAAPVWILAVASAHGFSKEVKEKAYSTVSLSSMTMAHELASAVLSEQVYRGLSILANHPYHND